jgi:hypothetical protein
MRFNNYEEGDVDVVIDDEAIAELEITDKVANAGARDYLSCPEPKA